MAEITTTTTSSSSRSEGRAPVKDPRTIARNYQLELCKKAVESNTIVYLGTGCGKTHIAVLVMCELGHLFRKPKKDVCVFLAPSVPLVRQQAVVIENSTDFEVQTYYGNTKHLKSHDGWEKEVQQYEVLVMTPQIFLQNLRHCFIKMELVALLIFDECHHAQLDKRHPYSLIMKEFYKANNAKCPHIFGMTASPIIGRGGSNQLEYTKCINSLEILLHAKVCGVDDNEELDSVVASPDIKVYFYGPKNISDSKITCVFFEKLEDIKNHSVSLLKNKKADLKEHKKRLRLLCKAHVNLTFCLGEVGLLGAIQAAQILLSNDGVDLTKMETEDASIDTCEKKLYLNKAISVLSCNFLNDGLDCDDFTVEALEEPFYSKKLLVLIKILQKYRERPNAKCIVFATRILVVKSLAFIFKSLGFSDFWKCEFLVGFHAGSTTRRVMNTIVEKFHSGKVNLLVATNVAEEGLDIPTCCLVIRFDLPETVASFIQSRGRARMSKSEYAFLVERGNQHEENLINEFQWSEDMMNKEIIERTSSDIFGCQEEASFRVESTGASISTGCSVSLLHHYCSQLPHDQYFSPAPKFFYIDDSNGTICRIILPSNSPIRQVDSLPSHSKVEAKRAACLKACVELHAQGALSDYLLPESGGDKKKPGARTSDSEEVEDDNSRKEIHEILIAEALKAPWSTFENQITLHLYYIKFIPLPEDREYRKFGVFVRVALPKEAESMEVDLHLAHGRIVNVVLIPSGTVTFTAEEIVLAQKFQEMSLKIILDRSEFISEFIPLGTSEPSILTSPTFYLLLPICGNEHPVNMDVDWMTLKICLSSPVFSYPEDSFGRVFSVSDSSETLVLAHGLVLRRDIVNSLVFSPHKKVFYFVDGIHYGTSANDKMKSCKSNQKLSYTEYYKNKHKIDLLHPEQPLLKAKQLFSARNLLHNRLQENTEVRELDEKFVELVPELCHLKIIGFSKDIGSSLSLLLSFMHRLENLLVAIQLKDVLSTSCSECSEITAFRVLEALTTENCLERFSLERLEVLGDAFLKYVVGRHSFLSSEALDEGQLTRKRSRIVNNSNLYELAIMTKLQVYIRVEFEPTNFFALGRPCKIVCDHDIELHSHGMADAEESSGMKCSKGHRWLYKKTIADVVEALVGAFLVDCGFKAAIAFLQWIGIKVSYVARDIQRICEESKSNISLINEIDIDTIESKLDYRFLHKGLLLQAFIHPSYTRHPGGCYQRLEFLGDAVLEYLITSYLYSNYPELKPGHLTDLKSITLSNISFARIAVKKSFNTFLIRDSESLTAAINIFERHVLTVDMESDLVDEPACPKALGDIIESCIGAVLLDSGFDLECVWRVMLILLEPAFGLSRFRINPIRELQELCQSCDFNLSFSEPVKEKDEFSVNVDVDMKDRHLNHVAINRNSKAARRFASQELLAKLKALGFKQKSLEEVLLTTRKEKPELIGFDEKPVAVYVDVSDSIQLDKLQLSDSEKASVHPLPMISMRSPVLSGGLNRRPSLPIPSPACQVEISETPRTSKCKQENVVGHVSDTSGSNNWNNDQTTKDSAVNVPAKSRLFEICTDNYWNPPSFVCCKEEGPGHSKKFTYTVIVEVQGAPDTILKCFSEPREKKKSAQNHAAEGALWYLKHLGYVET